MAESGRDFRERLLAAQTFSPALKEEHERQVRAMFERKLTGVRKWAWIGSGIMGVGFVVLFGTVAIVVPKEFPALGRVGFAVGAVFGLLWAGMAAWILKRGSINLRTHPKACAGLAWGFTVIIVTLFMLLGNRMPDKVTGIAMVVNGLVFLLMAAVFLIFARIGAAELETRQKLLEIEYRLAQISETLGPMPSERKE